MYIYNRKHIEKLKLFIIIIKKIMCPNFLYRMSSERILMAERSNQRTLIVDTSTPYIHIYIYKYWYIILMAP